MVKSIQVFRNNEYVFMPLGDYLTEYHNRLPEGWLSIIDWLNQVLEAKSDLDCDLLAKEKQVELFNKSKIRKTFNELKKEYSIFDIDILKFIAFLSGTTYFIKIGSPSIENWLNSEDINKPKKENMDFSFIDLTQYEFGQNAIRLRLLSTLRYISSQMGA